MAAKQWILGCGVGCLLVVVVLVIGGGVMVSKIKNTVAEFEDVGETQSQLTELYGDIDSYIPPADGRIDPARLDVFLSVQEKIFAPSSELAKALIDVRSMEEDSGFSFGKIRAALQGLGSLGTGAGRYISTRNNTLLEEEMGFGEFTYLSGLIYYGWLSRPLVLTIDNDENSGQARRWKRTSRMFKGFLQRQREAAREAGDPASIIPAIEDQLSELALDNEWVPWAEGGLPASTLESLEPYRERLEALYADTGLLLGMGADDDEGGFSFEIQ